MSDEFRGVGGSYVLVDGKRVPAGQVKPNKKPKKESEAAPTTEQPTNQEDAE